jgi:hypothetical protein
MTRPASGWPVTVAGITATEFNGAVLACLNRYRAGMACYVRKPFRGKIIMGKEARIGLLLAATCCLLAVMVDWIVEELK